ncbi:MAG: caspase family protein [Pseudomonadota bacterium]
MGKRALCVGINHFANYPGAALRGCVNDAHDMKDTLKSLLGFTDSDITVLGNADATKANVMKNLRSMVDGAKEGKYEYLVFSFSSHGTQIPDRSGDEPDSVDEAFCPHDLAEAGGEWDPDHIICDDELHDLFVQLPKNVLLEAYLDTCHSGTGLKAMHLLPDRKPRWMPPPSLEAFREIDGRASRGLTRSFMESGMTHHILWAACQSSELSSDANLGDSWHGAFTYYWCQVMRDCGNALSRQDVLNKVRELLKPDFSQIPQLECEATVRKESIT